MSKISLEPNASGAGTFSIVSPDSNTNRTLNLPDEAGTILSDASTIDSNNLQSDVYKQNNILGTVSESGGVPTGAVIERGSNSNGEFVKFADGTMFCTTVALTIDVDIVAGNIFRGLADSGSPWPAEFASVPKVLHTPVESADVRTWGGSTRSSDATEVRLRLCSALSRTSQAGFSIGIGRWY